MFATTAAPTLAFIEVAWVSQLGWPAYASGVIVAIDFLVKVVALGMVPENRRPSSSTAWLLLILFVPAIGIPAFFLLGGKWITKRRETIQATANSHLGDGAKGLPEWPESIDVPRGLDTLVHLSRSLTGLPMVTGTDRGLMPDYEASILRMAEVIDSAEEYVDVCIYILADDPTTEPFLAALERAAARGVAVRVLFDHLGSRKYPGFRRLKRRLTEAEGIRWKLMLPFMPLQGRMRRIDLRNHRKIVIVDGTVAFMGSQNLIESTYGSRRNAERGRRWVDVMIELTGPIVASLEALFVTDWFAEAGEDLSVRAYDFAERLGAREEALAARLRDGRTSASRVDGGQVSALQIVPSGPGFDTYPSLRLFIGLIHLAQERLRIVSPYFVPDEAMLTAITSAAHRGVAVELYVNEEADQFMVGHAQSSYYEALLDAGVEIHLYPSPLVLHTKCFTVDDLCSVMGSSNMDMRSFGLNYEVSMLAYGGDITEDLHALMDEYAAVSRVLTAEEWAERGYVRRWLDSVMRLTSALQ